MTAVTAPAVVWFRDDLRLSDNPALAAAVASGRPVIALNVRDEVSPGVRAPGGAKRWWLHHALDALARDLSGHGVRLVLRTGAAAAVVPAFAAEIGAGLVVWTRRYGAADIAVDTAVKSALKGSGVEARSFNGQLLHEPWEVVNGQNAPFRVFSPFWRAARARGPVRAPLPAPRAITPFTGDAPGETLTERRLLPTTPDWAAGLRATWTPGEAGARARFEAFLAGGFDGYAENRNRPDLPSTSMLSPHLSTGDISPVQVLTAASHAFETGRTRASESDLDKFASEIGWREFAFHLLGQFPGSRDRELPAEVRRFPLARGRGGLRGVEPWAHRLSDRGRRHARALDHRLDAQSRAHDRGILPGQAPADRLAPRRALVLGHARRRLPRQQHRELAVGRGHGRGRRPLFPHLQPGHAGHEVRPRRRLRPPLRAGTGETPDGLHPRPVRGAARSAGCGRHRARPRLSPPIIDLGEGRERALAALQSITAAA